MKRRNFLINTAGVLGAILVPKILVAKSTRRSNKGSKYKFLLKESPWYTDVYHENLYTMAWKITIDGTQYGDFDTIQRGVSENLAEFSIRAASRQFNFLNFHIKHSNEFFPTVDLNDIKKQFLKG